MKILKIIAALFMVLVLVACSKPDPLAEAKKNGFSSVAEMNEMKSLGHSTKTGYLLSILPTSGCSSIEELEHALSEMGGNCNDLKKYRYASKPMRGFNEALVNAYALIKENPIFLNHLVDNIPPMRIAACAAVGAYMSAVIVSNPSLAEDAQVKQHAINFAVTSLALEKFEAQGYGKIFDNFVYELKIKGADKVADIWPMCDGMLMMGFDLRNQDQAWNNALNNYWQRNYSHN